MATRAPAEFDCLAICRDRLLPLALGLALLTDIEPRQAIGPGPAVHRETLEKVDELLLADASEEIGRNFGVLCELRSRAGRRHGGEGALECCFRRLGAVAAQQRHSKALVKERIRAASIDCVP